MDDRRQRAARIVRDSENTTTLSEFDGMIIATKEVWHEGDGPARAQIRIPLNDPIELDWHLSLLRDAIDRARLLAKAAKTDRAAIIDAGDVLRRVNKQINAKRHGR
jgi:hypothetical protein